MICGNGSLLLSSFGAFLVFIMLTVTILIRGSKVLRIVCSVAIHRQLGYYTNTIIILITWTSKEAISELMVLGGLYITVKNQ